jgi:hypothetical protein
MPNGWFGYSIMHLINMSEAPELMEREKVELKSIAYIIG